MNTTTIYFIRHGEVYNPKRTVYNRNDIPLSKEGFRQIESLARRLKSRGVVPAAIYTSSLRRAVESAEKISQVYQGTKTIQIDDLQDTDARAVEGMSMDWLKSIDGDVYDSEETKDLGIERPQKIVERMLGVVEDVRKKYMGKTIFVVGHGDPLAFSLWRLLHPEGKLPSIVDLEKSGYLKKGEAWKFVFDEAGRVLKNELIARDENLVKGEREY